MTSFGSPRRHFAVCASTNDLARDWASDSDDPAPHGALVTADFQTRGRGRRGHRWDAAPAESALMSFILRPQCPLASLWQIGFVASLAVADALRGLGLDALLKWPNDVLINGRKIAGVLVETGLNLTVAGIGLNVNQSSFEALEYAYPPTSLRLATGSSWLVEDVVGAVAAAFGQWEGIFRGEGFAPVFHAWQEFLAVGATVRRGSEQAALIGLTPQGHACIRLADGTFTEWATVEAGMA